MDRTDLRLCRSLLFLPASNPRAIEKARGLGADMIVLDLEDAVKEEDKAAAREAAVAATQAGFGGRPVAVRVNPTSSPHYGADVVAVRRSAADFVILAKAESAKQVADAGWLMTKPVLAMIETPLAVVEAASIAPASRGLVAGTNDLGRASPCRRRRAAPGWSTRSSASCSPRAPPASPPSTASITGSRRTRASPPNAPRGAPGASTASR